MFTFKKWMWGKFTAIMGEDRAYDKYLIHFNHYQKNVVDSELQKDLNVKVLSKEEFLKVRKIKTKCKTSGCWHLIDIFFRIERKFFTHQIMGTLFINNVSMYFQYSSGQRVQSDLAHQF